MKPVHILWRSLEIGDFSRKNAVGKGYSRNVGIRLIQFCFAEKPGTKKAEKWILASSVINIPIKFDDTPLIALQKCCVNTRDELAIVENYYFFSKKIMRKYWCLTKNLYEHKNVIETWNQNWFIFKLLSFSYVNFGNIYIVTQTLRTYTRNSE